MGLLVINIGKVRGGGVLTFKGGGGGYGEQVHWTGTVGGGGGEWVGVHH